MKFGFPEDFAPSHYYEQYLLYGYNNAGGDYFTSNSFKLAQLGGTLAGPNAVFIAYFPSCL